VKGNAPVEVVGVLWLGFGAAVLMQNVECFYRVGATGIGALGAVGMGRSVDALGAENE
jgi:hypothetical protein